MDFRERVSVGIVAARRLAVGGRFAKGRCNGFWPKWSQALFGHWPFFHRSHFCQKLPITNLATSDFSRAVLLAKSPSRAWWRFAMSPSSSHFANPLFCLTETMRQCSHNETCPCRIALIANIPAQCGGASRNMFSTGGFAMRKF